MVQRLVTCDILIVKAQTATLKGVIESMTHSRLIHGNALLLIFALATAVANMGYPAVDAESRPLAGDPVQDARQPVVGFHATQRLPGLATAKPASDQGPVVIQVEVVDPDKKHSAEPTSSCPFGIHAARAPRNWSSSEPGLTARAGSGWRLLVIAPMRKSAICPSGHTNPDARSRRRACC